MGNALALKIREIHDTNLLKTLLLPQDQLILPFVHFIVKVNNYHPENLRRGLIISQFTILNILTNKEHTIRIERVESPLFFNGLDYSLEQIPRFENFLLVSNVVEESNAYLKGLNPRSSILLGTDNLYFSTFEHVEMAIKNKSTVYVFFDFINKNIFKIDFSINSKTDRLGFECELITRDEIIILINNKQVQTKGSNGKDENYGKIKSTAEEMDTLNIENISDDNSIIKNTNDKQVTKENSYKQIESFFNSNLNSIINNENYNKDLIFEENKLKLDSNSFDVYSKSNPTVENKIYNETFEDSYPHTNIFIQQINKIESKLQECLVSSNEEISSDSNLIYISSEKNESKNIIKDENENFNKKEIITEIKIPEENSSDSCRNDLLINKFQKLSEINGKNWNFSNHKLKSKYMKKLKIYEKLDSNYNFMKVSVPGEKKVTIIKGFHLCEDFVNIEPTFTYLLKNAIDVD